MPLKLPNLDDRTWNDLVEEGRSLIPAFAPEWTNYNPADAGVTLLELFAFLTETQIYRINRLHTTNLPSFLRLINGPEWKSGGDLDLDVRNTIREMHRPHRAVTVEDFELLTIAVNESIPEGEPRIERVIAVPDRDLESGKPHAQRTSAPGHVSVVVLSSNRRENSEPQDTAELLLKVRQALEPARLLTTVIHVVSPRMVEFGVRLTVTISRAANAHKIRKDVVEALRNFFDPYKGGQDGGGWPFGRNVFLSEIYRVASGVPGVVSVSRQFDRGAKRDLGELLVPEQESIRIVRNETRDAEAVEVRPDELVSLSIDPDDLLLQYEDTDAL